MPDTPCPPGQYLTHYCCGGRPNCAPFVDTTVEAEAFIACPPGYARIIVRNDSLGGDFTIGSTHCVADDDRLRTYVRTAAVTVISRFAQEPS